MSSASFIFNPEGAGEMCAISLKKTNKLQNQKDKKKVASETQTLGLVDHEKKTKERPNQAPKSRLNWMSFVSRGGKHVFR